MKVAIYCRISSDDKKDEAGVDRQEADCRDYARKMGWDIFDVFTDNDISAMGGKTRRRYEQMLSGIEAHDFDSVVVWHQDRITRNIVEFEDYITATTAGTYMPTYALSSGPLNLDKPDGKMHARMMAVLSNYTVEHNAFNNRRAKKGNRDEGYYDVPSKCPKLGYRPSGPHMIEVIPEDVPIVRQMHKDFQAGKAKTAIAAWLNSIGYDTLYKRAMTGERVTSLLRNATYAGLREYTDTKTLNGSRIGELSVGKWEAIITRETWEKTLDLLMDKTRPVKSGVQASSLLSGLNMVCGKCGSKITTQPMREDGSTAGYRCIHGHVTIRKAETDEYVIAEVLRLIRDSGTTKDAPRLRRELAGITGKLRDYAQMFNADSITREQFETGTRLLRDRESIINSQLKSMGISPSQGNREWWDSLDFSEQREIIRGTVDITLRPAKDVGNEISARVVIVPRYN